MSFKIGFTGTRNGMTEEQKLNVLKVIEVCTRAVKTDMLIALHGDCIGADADFHHICVAMGLKVHIYPCTFENMRAYCKGDWEEKPLAPMQRNRNIVAAANIMIACPPNMTPIKSGSGTWATIGFSKKANKKTFVLYPDGSFDS